MSAEITTADSGSAYAGCCVVEEIAPASCDTVHLQLAPPYSCVPNAVVVQNILARQPGPEVAEQLSTYQGNLREKTKQMKAMASELNMYQAQVRFHLVFRKDCLHFLCDA